MRGGVEAGFGELVRQWSAAIGHKKEETEPKQSRPARGGTPV